MMLLCGMTASRIIIRPLFFGSNSKVVLGCVERLKYPQCLCHYRLQQMHDVEPNYVLMVFPETSL
jgi:hypothetical protein